MTRNEYKSYPQAEVVSRLSTMELRARLVVENDDGNDRMTLRCEAKDRPAGLVEAVVASIRELTKLRGEVVLVEPVHPAVQLRADRRLQQAQGRVRGRPGDHPQHRLRQLPRVGEVQPAEAVRHAPGEG